MKTSSIKLVSSSKGFGIVEVIVAVAIFVIIAVTGVSTVVRTFTTNRQADEETEAALFAQEGIEAARSIRNQGWESPFLATDCSSGCGVDSSGGNWIWSGSSDTLTLGVGRAMTRIIQVQQVQRDTNGDIVESGGTVDTNTYKVISTVSWDFTEGRNNVVEVSSYVTNFKAGLTCSWDTVTQIGNIDISGNQNGIKVDTKDDYAYVVRDDGSPDFIIIDISNQITPTIVGNLELIDAPTNIFIDGNYAYVTSNSNSQELQVIDISTSSTPSQVGSLNLSGNADALGVYLSGTVAYVSRASNANEELYLLNISIPTTPLLLSSLEIGSDVNEVYVKGNYAYVVTDDNSGELIVVDITNSLSPSIVASLDLVSNDNAETISGYGDYVFVGRSSNTGRLHVIDISTPTSPSEIGNYSATDDIRDIAVNEDENVLFLATDDLSDTAQIVDISTPTSPSLKVSYTVSGVLNGISYSLIHDSVVAVGEDDSNEFIILGGCVSVSPTPTLAPTNTPTQPTLTPTLAPTNTPTPAIVSCSDYCVTQGYSSGNCRQNSVQCSLNGETYESGGNSYCIGGSNADTCCCTP